MVLGASARGSDPLGEYHVDLSGLGYGHTSQTDPGINFGEYACGPTAAINSFFFLQNQYKFTTLGPGNGLLSEDNAAEAVNEIGSLMHLNESGVTIQNFITGKEEYLAQHGLGNRIGIEWQSQYVGGIIPTWDWLYRQLKAKQDVEIAFSWMQLPPGGGGAATGDGTAGGHMVTLTSFDFSDANANGFIDADEATLDFMDPYGGTHLSASITMDGPFMDIYYVGGGAMNGAWGQIHSAVAESPIPEPSTYGLFGAVLLIIGVSVSRLRAKR